MTTAPEMKLIDSPGVAKPDVRRVVFHADDFGFNEPITRGIVEGFEQGILTSTSALANAPFLGLALSFWKSLDERRQSGKFPSAPQRRSLGDDLAPFDFGVHLNLTQGRPLTGDQYPSQLLDRNGFFPGIYSLFAKLSLRPRRFIEPIRRELEAQIARLKDSSVELTHLNGHQYLELIPTIAHIVPDLARRFSIPVIRTAAESGFTSITLFHGELENWLTTCLKRYYAGRLARIVLRNNLLAPLRYFGASHSARVSKPILAHYLKRITGDGLTEICVHPATLPGTHTLVDAPGWEDPFETARPKELQLIESSECFELLRSHRISLGRLRSLTSDSVPSAD